MTDFKIDHTKDLVEIVSGHIFTKYHNEAGQKLAAGCEGVERTILVNYHPVTGKELELYSCYSGYSYRTAYYNSPNIIKEEERFDPKSKLRFVDKFDEKGNHTESLLFDKYGLKQLKLFSDNASAINKKIAHKIPYLRLAGLFRSAAQEPLGLSVVGDRDRHQLNKVRQLITDEARANTSKALPPVFAGY